MAHICLFLREPHFLRHFLHAIAASTELGCFSFMFCCYSIHCTLFWLYVCFCPFLLHCRHLKCKHRLALASSALNSLVGTYLMDEWMKFPLHCWALCSTGYDCLFWFCLGIFMPLCDDSAPSQFSVAWLSHINGLTWFLCAIALL